MEKLHPTEMKKFYLKHGLKKSGHGPGGKFNGPKIRHLLKEETLKELQEMLPEVEEPFIVYFKSLRELDRVCVTSHFEKEDWEQKLYDFEQNFFYLYECFNLNMTLKVHVIIHHYRWYFIKTGKKFKDTNGEFVETVHYTLKNMKNKKDLQYKYIQCLENGLHASKGYDD